MTGKTYRSLTTDQKVFLQKVTNDSMLGHSVSIDTFLFITGRYTEFLDELKPATREYLEQFARSWGVDLDDVSASHKITAIATDIASYGEAARK